MASSLPAALKSADITRFAQRAGQVEKAKPSIAYWCTSDFPSVGRRSERSSRQLLDCESIDIQGSPQR